MQELVINNLKHFYDLILELNLEEDCFKVIETYRNSVGGCNCSKKYREIYADTTYKKYLNNPYNLYTMNKIKEKKNINKIIFKNDLGEILKEI